LKSIEHVARKKERKPRAVPGGGQDLKTKAQVIFQGQNHHKNRRKVVILNQWIEIEVENGQTITKLYPSNEKLIEEGKTMLPPPDMVYRRLNFPAGVLSEYFWASHDPDARKWGGTGIQRMTVDTWLRVTEREKAEGTGHIGPTGIGTLQRPEENGVCECQVCARNTATSETRILEEPD
jgi:hypothetical protein